VQKWKDESFRKNQLSTSVPESKDGATHIGNQVSGKLHLREQTTFPQKKLKIPLFGTAAKEGGGWSDTRVSRLEKRFDAPEGQENQIGD